MIILALDPGETTGYVIVQAAKANGTEPDIDIEDTGVLSLWRGVDHLIEEHEPQLIIAEQYRLLPSKAKSQSYSIIVSSRVLGVIQYLAEERKIPLILQSPPVARFHRLPKEIFRRTRGEHIRDAMLHIWAYLKTQKEVI